MLTHPSNTREKLMRAAMDIVAADGFGAATTAAIAARSGMAEGTLYRHFKSKDELMIAAYRQLKADVFERVSAETGEHARGEHPRAERRVETRRHPGRRLRSGSREDFCGRSRERNCGLERSIELWLRPPTSSLRDRARISRVDRKRSPAT